MHKVGVVIKITVTLIVILVVVLSSFNTEGESKLNIKETSESRFIILSCEDSKSEKKLEQYYIEIGRSVYLNQFGGNRRDLSKAYSYLFGFMYMNHFLKELDIEKSLVKSVQSVVKSKMEFYPHDIVYVKTCFSLYSQMGWEDHVGIIDLCKN
jgi:hypothetical protein